MKKIIFFLWLAIPSLIYSVTLNVSKEELSLIKKAVKVYRALHAGDGKFITTSIENKGNKAIVKRSLVIAGERFNFVDTIKLGEQRKKNNVYLSLGGGLSLFYSRDILGPFSLQAGLFSVDGKWYAQGGIGFKF